MKYLLILLLICSISSAFGQNAKVLVCAPRDLSAARSTDSLLAKFYTDSIDISDTITGAINSYDAVFIVTSASSYIDSTDEVMLRHFLRGGKKLFLEYHPFSYGMEHFHIDSSSFWHYVGIDFISIDDVNFGIKSVEGMPGTFTEALSVENKQYTPTDDNFGTWILTGRITRVLSPLPDASIDIADLFETDSFKVVLHLPTLPDYREEFLHRVICNYFGLCTPVREVQNPSGNFRNFSLYPNPTDALLHIRSNDNHLTFRTGEIISETGAIVTTIPLNNSMDQIDLDLRQYNLLSGNYFLRFTSPKEQVVKPFFFHTK